MPLIGQLIGHYPGRQLGFAGRESRGVIADWTRTGRTGHYDLPELRPFTGGADAASSRFQCLACELADDWFVPEALAQLANGENCPPARVTAPPPPPLTVINDDDLDGQADHFGWMRSPERVARVVAEHFK